MSSLTPVRVPQLIWTHARGACRPPRSTPSMCSCSLGERGADDKDCMTRQIVMHVWAKQPVEACHAGQAAPLVSCLIQKVMWEDRRLLGLEEQLACYRRSVDYMARQSWAAYL